MRAPALLLLLSHCWDHHGDDEDTGGDADFESLNDVIDLSVNDASAGVVDDDAGGLRLLTEAGDNEVGGFNGSGTGNKSIAGLPGFDGLALADFSGAAYETTSVTDGSTPYLNVVVDLDCTGTTYKVLVADTSEVASPTSVGDATRYEYAASGNQWKAVGGLDDLLPSHLAAGAGGTLSSVVAAYPDACLRDAETGDNGLPACEETTAIMLILGDSVNHSALEHRVSAIEVGSERYEAE